MPTDSQRPQDTTHYLLEKHYRSPSDGDGILSDEDIRVYVYDTQIPARRGSDAKIGYYQPVRVKGYLRAIPYLLALGAYFQVRITDGGDFMLFHSLPTRRFDEDAHLGTVTGLERAGLAPSAAQRIISLMHRCFRGEMVPDDRYRHVSGSRPILGDEVLIRPISLSLFIEAGLASVVDPYVWMTVDEVKDPPQAFPLSLVAEKGGLSVTATAQDILRIRK